ncbi:hypothetical protein EMIT0P258_130117 [Pseudomonas sp. IT-P258]
MAGILKSRAVENQRCCTNSVARELAPAGSRSDPNSGECGFSVEPVMPKDDCYAAERDDAAIRQAPSPQKAFVRSMSRCAKS